MGRHCEICEASADKCEMPSLHLSRKAEDRAVAQEVKRGKWMEECRKDAEMGREALEFEVTGPEMADEERKGVAQQLGAAYARAQAQKREERIGAQACDICWTTRRECEWPEVHFSREGEWVAFCNEVRYAMHQERCKADEEAGRGCETWRVGKRLQEGDPSKEKAVAEGLKYAKKHAAAYEERCAAGAGEVEAVWQKLVEENAVAEGLKYAQKHAAAYEAQVV